MANSLSINRHSLLDQAGPEVRVTLSFAATAWLWLAFAPTHSAHWPAMVFAMMLPMLVPQIAHVRARSFGQRKLRATLLFAATYILAWIVVGAIAAIALTPVTSSPAFAPLTCLFAALWQFSPQKRRALLRCHSRPVLAAFGSRADIDNTLFGLTYARSCMTSCLPMMLVMLGNHSLNVMICLTMIIMCERADHRPDPRASAIALLLTALLLTQLGDVPLHNMH